MATSPRSEDALPEREGEGQDWRPGESGTRACPPDGRDDTIEELDASDLEPVAAAPAPKRRSTPPPAPPLASLRRQEPVNIDAIVRDASRSPVPVIPSAPVIVRPSRGPSWAAALVLTASATIIGACTALAIVMTSDAPAVTAPAAAAKADLPKRLPSLAIAPIVERASARIERHAAPSASGARGRAVSEPAVERRLTRAERIARARAARTTRRNARRAAAAAPPAAAPTTAEPSAPRAAAEPEPASRAELPDQPTRADVERAVASVLPSVRECASGLGVVELELHFAPTGRTTVARADSTRATPAQRSCMARAARAARVPPFSGAHLTVRYPAQI